MDYPAAKKYMLERLAKELPPDCFYHDYAHTQQVLEAVDVLAEGESVSDKETLDLLRTAAVYHDCGFFEKYQANEPEAARIAADVLPSFGYTKKQIEFIGRLILVTALGAEPTDVYEQIIKDADFDYLGREGYLETSFKLKEEWAVVMNVHYTMKEWYALQQRFLEGHRFYTGTAKRIRGPVKEKHIELVKSLMAAEK